MRPPRRRSDKFKKSENVPGKPRKLAILGGAFNPVHIGHLVCAEEACQEFGLDEVVFIPTGTAPHKEIAEGASAEERLRMVELATAGNPRFSVSRHELDSGEVSYTVETLRHFRGTVPDAELFFITGSDAVNEILEWKEPAEIAKLATLVVAIRPGYPVEAAPQPVQDFLEDSGALVLPVTGIDISSTQLRERVAAGRSIRYLVPENVETLIEEEQLYRTR